MLRTVWPVITTTLFVLLFTSIAFADTTASKTATALRNKRYCEVVSISRRRLKFIASVYSTQGFSECPDAAWKAMDPKAIQNQFHALQVKMNGPRYWTMDEIVGKGETLAGEKVKIGSLDFCKRAEIELSLFEMKSIPYKERNIKRETQYVFKANKPIYELISPTKQTYVMHSYSQIVDPKLKMEDLAKLGQKLKLPSGWQYRSIIPVNDVILSANGLAHLVQDDLQNSYQRIEKTDTAPAD